jgi:hypothetical protein
MQRCAIGPRPERWRLSRVLFEQLFVAEIAEMDQRDQELLDKQLRRLNPSPRNNSVMVLAVLGVFFAGVTLGGFLSGHISEATQIASNDATPAISLPNGAPLITRR